MYDLLYFGIMLRVVSRSMERARIRTMVKFVLYLVWALSGTKKHYVRPRHFLFTVCTYVYLSDVLSTYSF